MAGSVQFGGGRLHPPGTRKGNRYWVWRGRINGKPHEFSTGQADKRHAQGFAEQAIASLDTLEQGSPMTFATVADLYADHARLSVPGRRFLDYINVFIGDERVDEIASRHITQIERTKPKVAPATINRSIRKPIRAVLMWAHEQDLCDRPKIKMLKESEPTRRAPPDDLAPAMLAATDGHRHAFVSILHFQGWRLSEALALTWNDVDLDNLTFRYFVPKAAKWKVNPMHPAVADALKALTGRSGRVFQVWSSQNAVYKWWKPLVRRLGCPDVTPHQLRHAWASEMRKAGATAPDMVQGGSWTNTNSVANYLRDPNPHVSDLVGHLWGKSDKVLK